MKKILVLWIFISFLSAETITRDELLDMGCYRIGDLLYHIKTAEYTTVDGFHYSTRLHNYNRSGTNFYKIFIDEHLFSANVIEGSQLNWLPIDVNSIDSVVIVEQNGFYKGEFMQDGAIQIYTRKNKQIISANAGGNWGNESGDPGPLKYTELETENVDKIGQNLNSYLSINLDDNYISGFVNYRQHTYRDPRIFSRIKAGMGREYWIGMDQFSAGQMINLKNQSLMISQVYGKNCFYYHPLYEIEFPADIYYDHVSYAGSINLFGLVFTLRSMWENYHSEYIDNSYAFDLNWNLRNISNNFTFTKGINGFQITGTFDYDLIEFSGENYHKFENLWSISHDSDNLHNQMDISYGRFNGINNVENQFKTAFNSTFIFEEKNRINTNIFVQSVSSFDALDVKYFLLKELSDESNYYRMRGSVSDGITLGFNVTAELKEMKQFHIKMGVPFNYNFNKINKQDHFGNYDEYKLASDRYLHENYFSSSYGFHAQAELFLNQQISATGFYQIICYLFDDHFDLVNNEFYTSKALISVKYKPSRSFSTIFKMNYWKSNFQKVHYITYPKHEIKTIDVSLIKYFWHNRFSANLMLKNLMNTRYWLHNEGIAFDRSMYFGVNCWL